MGDGGRRNDGSGLSGAGAAGVATAAAMLGVPAVIVMPADAPALRTGMSAYVEIDTGHQRQIADLFDGARQAVGL